jgi:hypothetical protein
VRTEHCSFHLLNAEPDAELQVYYPLPLDGDSVMSAAAREQIPVLIDDTKTDTGVTAIARDVARHRDFRSLVVVPMRAKLRRSARFPWAIRSENDVRLLQTFADQAVIAIENTRLFEAEQASKREYQTAITEVLDVISRSPTNSQPVLDTIAVSIRRLSRSTHGSVFLFHGGQIHLASHAGLDPAIAQVRARSFPQVPGRGGATASALIAISDYAAIYVRRITNLNGGLKKGRGFHCRLKPAVPAT